MECLAINNKWNEETAKARDGRICGEREQKAKYIQERLQLKVERDREMTEKADELVRLEKVFYIAQMNVALLQ